MDLRFLLLLKILLGLLVIGVHVHRCALHALTLRSANHWRFHAHDVTVGILENRRWHLNDTRHKRGVDQLEVKLLLRVVREHRAVVRQVQLEEVLDAKGLREDGLWDKLAHIEVVASMLPIESRTFRLGLLASNLELQDELLGFTWSSKEEAFLAHWASSGPLLPVLVNLDLDHVRDDKRACVRAL